MEVNAREYVGPQMLKPRNASNASINKNSSNNQVKLCGYLKKKRNKVGWRKMWFVLQDKLLLSYSSKEEYDNKLVSFKDVLNLVPGTLVRPLSGFRFTIETTSHAIYTFHCDDRNAYREWITKLLDSLTMQSSLATPKYTRSFSNFFGFPDFPMDNVPRVFSMKNGRTERTLMINNLDHLSHVEIVEQRSAQLRTTTTTKPTMDTSIKAIKTIANTSPTSLSTNSTSSSSSLTNVSASTSSSIASSTSPPVAASGVRIPIAYNTAKLLERNGVNETNLPVNCHNNNNNNSNDNQKTSTKVVEDSIQWHQQELKYKEVNESSACCPIATTSAGSDRKNCDVRNAQKMSQLQTLYMPVSLLNRKLRALRPDFKDKKNNFTNLKEIQSDNGRTMEQASPFYTKNDMRKKIDQTVNTKPVLSSSAVKRSPLKQRTTSATRTDFLINVCTIKREYIHSLENRAVCLVKDKIHRMNIKGSSEMNMLEEESSNVLEHTNHSKVTTSKTIEQIIMKQQQKKDHGESAQHNEDEAINSNNANAFQGTTTSLEPIYAVIDLKHKYAQRNLRKSNFELKRYNSYDSIIQKQQQQQQKQMYETTANDGVKNGRHEKSISYTEDELDGIYEDGEIFFNTNDACTKSDITPLHTALKRPQHEVEKLEDTEDDDVDENIYEPIDIQTNTNEPNSNYFWKYLSGRLKMNSFLQLTRIGKRNAPEYDAIKVPANVSSVSTQSVTVSNTRKGSHFTNIRKKFGTHRKSMQKRVRKLCTSSSYEPRPFCSTPHQISENKQQISESPALTLDSNEGKKNKHLWKSMKIRQKKVSPPTNENIQHGRRFFGSLPHLRKQRTSIFTTTNELRTNMSSCSLSTNNRTIMTTDLDSC